MPEHVSQLVLASQQRQTNRRIREAANRSPLMFLLIFSAWLAVLAWFGPRLIESLDAAQGPVSRFALGYFVVFIPIAWLYGIYNLSVVMFSVVYRLQNRQAKKRRMQTAPLLCSTRRVTTSSNPAHCRARNSITRNLRSISSTTAANRTCKHG